MARCGKKQKRAVILRRKRILKRCFLSFEKSSFLVKTVLWNKIQKLDVAFKEYNRNPRRVGRKRSTDWCDNDMLLIVQRMRNSFSSTKVHEFLCFVGVFEADWEAILLAWVTCQQNDDLLLSSRM